MACPYTPRLILRWSSIIVVVALTLLPILNIITIIATTGANNLSNDLIAYVAMIDKIFNGNYEWRNYFRDTFIRSHFTALPVFIRIVAAYFSHWNIYIELYIGIVLSFFNLLLLYNTFTYSTQSSFNKLLLPILAALVFSTSRIDVFSFGDTSLLVILSVFGVLLGIWGLARFPRSWRGVGIMAAGGLIASWSWGVGLMAWPVFFIGLVLLRFRKIWHYAIWFSLCVVALLPYFVFLVLMPISKSESIFYIFNYGLIADSIGLPLTLGLQQSKIRSVGQVGIALFSVGMGLLWFQRKTSALEKSAPALMLVAFGLFSAWQISVFRGGLAPWYTTPFMIFWIGLVGLVYALWTNQKTKSADRIPLNQAILISTPLWSMIVLGILSFLYVKSNITYLDKVFYLYSRSPVAASCLREYRTAPTYCEQYPFQWGVGNPHLLQTLAQPLERHKLSTFSSHQKWALQGDFALDTVRTFEEPNVIDIFWSADLSGTSVPWYDFRHLNLFLHSPNSISWTVSLPANLQKAEFHSAVGMSTTTPKDGNPDGATFEVYLKPEGETERLAFSKFLKLNQRSWHPFTIGLSAYAGKTITLRLTSNMGSNYVQDWAMYKHPYIDIILKQDGATTAQSDRITPSNTELAPSFPKPTANDVRFDVTNASLWKTSNQQSSLTGTQTTDTWIVTKEPMSVQYEQSLNDLCLADYSHFYIKVAASEKITPRALQIYYKIDKVNEFSEQISFKIPLLGDGAMHTYSYDLKLLELHHQSHLTGIRLVPLVTRETTVLASDPKENWVKIPEFGLIHSGKPSQCALAKKQ